jgi:hypothetical protein
VPEDLVLDQHDSGIEGFGLREYRALQFDAQRIRSDAREPSDTDDATGSRPRRAW